MAHTHDRRSLLKAAGMLLPVAVGALGTTLGPLPALARPAARRLSFYHTHTGEALDVVYAENGSYIADALTEIDFLLRDFRSGDVHPIDPNLLDILSALQDRVGHPGTFEVISGFRSPATNEMLRHQSSGQSGVSRKSLHLRGQAIDIRLTGAETSQLRRTAISMARGGVGYYPESDFLHLDTGRVRSW